MAAIWRRRHEPWQGVAVLSCTNVAKDEVEAGLRRGSAACTLLQHPHFVGTLAFVNQYLFLPHSAATMGFSGARPTLVGEPSHQWRAPWSLHSASPEGAYKPMFFDCYTIDRDGRPLRVDATPRSMGSASPVAAQQVSPSNLKKITTMKQFVWGQGMALQADANYLAYQTLLSRPELAAALAHVVLVGDENQANYEWNTANPDGSAAFEEALMPQLFGDLRTAAGRKPRWPRRTRAIWGGAGTRQESEAMSSQTCTD
jgi:DNA helicase II / ATP-dependent DNA helicase PcrA